MDFPSSDDREEQLLLSHHAAASPALRYSAVHPVQMDGWLAKEGKALRARRTRYLRLNAHILSSHRAKSSPPSWQISVADAIVEKGLHPREIKISLPHRSLSLVAPTTDAFDSWIVALRRASVVSSRVDDYYTIGRLIGEGMNGQVRLATDMLTDDTVAIKMVPRLGRENETQFLAREVQIILSVNHPNIVRTIDVFVTRRRIHFVMEYLAGGELFDFIAENTHFTEAHAATVMADLLNALYYLHHRGIAHRDVKLENLLCANSTWPLNVKLADFGFANYVNSGNEPMLSSFVGTPYYIAPEMLRADPHGRPVDIWASGVVLYILLSGKFPFGGRNESEYYQRVLSKEAYFPAEEWTDVSEDAKDLVRGMLCKDPEKRLTAEQCLRHTWLKRVVLTPEPESPIPAPHPDVFPQDSPQQSSEANLQSPNVFRNNREKRGRWRQLGMLNHSLSSPTETVLETREHAKAPHLESHASHPANRPHASIDAVHRMPPDDSTVNRRPSLIRRLLSSGKLSLDRYEGRFPSFRGSVEEADEATATPRKTLSLFARDGPLRRSFHRVGVGEGQNKQPIRGAADGINFVNSQTKRLPPKVARERQRIQRQAEANRKSARATSIFGHRKSASSQLMSSSTPATPTPPTMPHHHVQVANATATTKQSVGNGYHSSPRLHTPSSHPFQAMHAAPGDRGSSTTPVVRRSWGADGGDVRAGHTATTAAAADSAESNTAPGGTKPKRTMATSHQYENDVLDFPNVTTPPAAEEERDSDSSGDEDALRRTMSAEVSAPPPDRFGVVAVGGGTLVLPDFSRGRPKGLPEMRVRPVHIHAQPLRS